MIGKKKVKWKLYIIEKGIMFSACPRLARHPGYQNIGRIQRNYETDYRQSNNEVII